MRAFPCLIALPPFLRRHRSSLLGPQDSHSYFGRGARRSSLTQNSEMGWLRRAAHQGQRIPKEQLLAAFTGLEHKLQVADTDMLVSKIIDGLKPQNHSDFIKMLESRLELKQQERKQLEQELQEIHLRGMPTEPT